MRIIHVYYSSRFKKSLSRFNQRDQKRIKKQLKLFLVDPLNPQLKTHKLTGKLKDYWSFSITYHLRILFEFIDKETVGLIDIGTHEIYK